MMPQQEVKPIKIVIPSFTQYRITTLLMNCPRQVETNI